MWGQISPERDVERQLSVKTLSERFDGCPAILVCRPVGRLHVKCRAASAAAASGVDKDDQCLSCKAWNSAGDLGNGSLNAIGPKHVEGLFCGSAQPREVPVDIQGRPPRVKEARCVLERRPRVEAFPLKPAKTAKARDEVTKVPGPNQEVNVRARPPRPCDGLVEGCTLEMEGVHLPLVAGDLDRGMSHCKSHIHGYVRT